MLSAAFTSAKIKLAGAKASPWSMVHGPAAATVATSSRIGWESNDGRHFCDDAGNDWDVAVDSPAAIAEAARRSITRWTLKKVIKEIPSVAPPIVETGARTLLADLTPALRPLYKGGKRFAKQHPRWSSEHRAYLTSAISGGQWPQERKSHLPNWAEGKRCLLCKEQVGTIAHRKCCRMTLPSEGWPEPSTEVKQFGRGISDVRANNVASRAVLTVAYQRPRPQEESSGWQWISKPDDITDESLTWYIDGSRRYPSDWELATTGCGVAVVWPDGSLA